MAASVVDEVLTWDVDGAPGDGEGGEGGLADIVINPGGLEPPPAAVAGRFAVVDRATRWHRHRGTSLLDNTQLNEADINAIGRLVRVPSTTVTLPDDAGRAQQRAEPQEALASGRVSLEAFMRTWKALDRPRRVQADPDRDALEKARQYLADFGGLWRDPDVPAQLKEEAAREIFEELEVFGDRVVGVHPRAEQAWLLGMEATRREDLVLVGARGLGPASAKCTIVVPPAIYVALAA